MTYGEKIEDLIKQINSIYNDAEWLRDYATGDEKDHWNELRRVFYDADKPLRKLNRIIGNRSEMKL